MLFYARALNPDYRPKFSDHGWNCRLKAKKIRNRITHPKNIAELKISHQEMTTIDTGEQWYIKTGTEPLMPWVEDE